MLRISICLVGFIATTGMGMPSNAQPLALEPQAAATRAPAVSGPSSDMPLSLGEFSQEPRREEVSRETVSTTEYVAEAAGDLGGPFYLRSADPAEPGEMEFKFIYGYETAKSGGTNEFAFELEWGLTEDIEFILETPLTLGEGNAEGNGDVEVGLHTRFWKEQDWLPAFAWRNLLLLPSGHESEGLEWESRGLFTKTLVPGKLRAHFNPYLKLDCRDEEDVRYFQWGAALGIDYRVAENLVLIADYQHRAGEYDGWRNNHSMEIGAEYEIAPHHHVGLSTEFSLDGDSYGPDWGVKASYWFTLDSGLALHKGG